MECKTFINASGVWDYYQIGEYSGCTLNEIDGPFTEAGSVSITQTDNRITLGVRYETGEICTFNLIGTQSGNYVDAIGSFSCNYGIAGNAALNDIRVIDDFLTLRMDLQLTTGETCRQQSDLGAIK